MVNRLTASFCDEFEFLCVFVMTLLASFSVYCLYIISENVFLMQTKNKTGKKIRREEVISVQLALVYFYTCT